MLDAVDHFGDDGRLALALASTRTERLLLPGWIMAATSLFDFTTTSLCSPSAAVWTASSSTRWLTVPMARGSRMSTYIYPGSQEVVPVVAHSWRVAAVSARQFVTNCTRDLLRRKEESDEAAPPAGHPHQADVHACVGWAMGPKC